MLASAYHRFRPYLHNTSWIIGEKLVVLGLGFLTTIVLARYLGPERFGTLAYATSSSSRRSALKYSARPLC
jgi:O-antigen/teichoic acid export membrane protein